MKISELINKLSNFQKQHGDIICVVRKDHEYWGSVDSLLSEYNFYVKNNCQPDGPKSGKEEKGVVFSAE